MQRYVTSGAVVPPGSLLDFVKVDVEGAEARGLAGMTKVLKTQKLISLVEFHHNDGWAGRKTLLSAGYSLLDLHDTPVDVGEGAPRVCHCVALSPG
jgi:hypothetical protein